MPDVEFPIGPLATDDIPAPAAPSTGAAECANCLAPRTGHFCAQCGAPSLDERPLTVRRFADDLWQELTSLDSSTARTLRSLFTRPGELTRAYLSGRTRWFLSPLRIYLLMFAVYVFAQSFLPSMESTLRHEVQSQLPPTTNAATLQQRARFSGAIAAAIAESARNQWLQLVNAATWALVLALIYRRRRASYAEHVVMAMHLLAFNVALLLVTQSLRAALQLPVAKVDPISFLHWLGIGTYFYFASRAVFGDSRARTAAHSVFFVIGAQVMMIVPAILAAGLGLLGVLRSRGG